MWQWACSHRIVAVVYPAAYRVELTDFVDQRFLFPECAVGRLREVSDQDPGNLAGVGPRLTDGYSLSETLTKASRLRRQVAHTCWRFLCKAHSNRDKETLIDVCPQGRGGQGNNE